MPLYYDNDVASILEAIGNEMRYGWYSRPTCSDDLYPLRWSRDASRTFPAHDAGDPLWSKRVELNLILLELLRQLDVAGWDSPAIHFFESLHDATQQEGGVAPIHFTAATGREYYITASLSPRSVDCVASIVGIAAYNPSQNATATASVQAALEGGGPGGGDSWVELAPAGAGYYGIVWPSAELLATLRERARGYAGQIVLQAPAASIGVVLGDERQMVPIPIGAHTSGQELVARARARYLEAVRSKLRGGGADHLREFERKRAEHRQKSQTNFRAFRNKAATTECYIPTLPFLPHGLASSRRWGIEIESGGARGISAPPRWTRKRDGSLRSAWEGYREVQDFEPYDEEVTEVLSWRDCDQADLHMPHEEYFEPETQSYMWRMREGYIPAAECDRCGRITRLVHREPRTITHRGQGDDCAEFVSPILTSMHSNGLESLLAEIALQPQNDSAGVHVHVESNDLTATQINTLIYGYDLLERFIEASYQRTRRDYCKRNDESDSLRAARDAKAKLNDMSTYQNRDRYLTVNTQALSAHGTIEFRAMGPVYEYDHLIRWAMFCRSMVQAVANGATTKDFGRIRKWEDALAMFIRFNTEIGYAILLDQKKELKELQALADSLAGTQELVEV